MPIENAFAFTLTRRAEKARFFADRLGPKDAELLRAYAAECEARVRSFFEPAQARAA